MLEHRRLAVGIVAISAIAGIIGTNFFYAKQIGVSFPLYIGICLAALFALRRPAERVFHFINVWVVAPLAVFALFIAVRDDMLINSLNILAVLTLGGLLLHYLPLPKPIDLEPFGHLIGSALQVSLSIIPLSFYELGQAWSGLRDVRGQWGERATAIVRGLLLALPIVLVFAGLLASADAVFSKYMMQFWDSLGFRISSESITATMLMLFLSSLVAGGLGYALARKVPEAHNPSPTPIDGEGNSTTVPDSSPVDGGGKVGVSEPPSDGELEHPDPAVTPTPHPLQDKNKAKPGFKLNMIESSIILGSVVTLFAAFVIIQFAYFFGGQANISVEGLTYAQYARRGFFELVTTGVLTLGLALLLDRVTVRQEGRETRLFQGLGVALVALTIVMVISAAQRMWLYEQAYGFTQLRVYTHVAIFCLAALFGVFALLLFRVRPAIFSFGLLLVIIGYLLVLNIINVDRYVAERNIARYTANPSAGLDAAFLNSLSADASEPIAQLFHATSEQPKGAAHVWAGQWLARQYGTLSYLRSNYGATALSWNASRASAWALLDAMRQELPAIDYSLSWYSVTIFDDTMSEYRP